MKTFLMALSLTLSLPLLAQESKGEIILWWNIPSSSGSDTSFSVIGKHLDPAPWCKNLADRLGQSPVTDELSWTFSNLTVEGLGSGLSLRVWDGFYTYNPTKKQARKGVFTTKGQRNKFLKSLAKSASKPNEEFRAPNFDLRDASGNSVIDSGIKAKRFMDWLNTF